MKTRRNNYRKFNHIVVFTIGTNYLEMSDVLKLKNEVAPQIDQYLDWFGLKVYNHEASDVAGAFDIYTNPKNRRVDVYKVLEKIQRSFPEYDIAISFDSANRVKAEEVKEDEE